LIRRVAVVVPAANEERHIGKCLSSIGAARRHLYQSHANIQVRIVVALDDCVDSTAAIAAASGDVLLVTVSAQGVSTTRGVGAARRAGVSAALAGTSPASELWLANTDADCEVPVNWLTSMVHEARRGAHVVLGTVVPGSGLHPGARAEWASRHHLREGHPHVHGANFGIRGDAYLALGGWQPLVTGEDTDLARRATRAGHLRVARIAAIPVVTSVRRNGRAPRGFSSYLRALDATGVRGGSGGPQGGLACETAGARSCDGEVLVPGVRP
jgi:glycosyltransferase involved in cell wall biosynthesis